MDIFSLKQAPASGYRYTLDSFLLARFSNFKSTDTVCDLGAGVGVLGFLLLSRSGIKKVVSIEVQEEFVALAKENIQKTGFEKQMQVIHKNWKELPQLFHKAGFEGVISNPPYRKAKTGRVSPDLSKAVAKHEILGTMQDLFQTAFYLLKPRGKFCLMYPTLRFEECMSTLEKVRLRIHRLQFIQSYPDKPANLFMLEAVKFNPKEPVIEAPLVVYQDSKHYTPAVEEWVGKKIRLL